MLLKIKDQIELNYEFNKKIFDDDVEIDVDEIVEIIKNIVDEFNENNDVEIQYDDIFLNVDVDEIIKKKIKYVTNILYKILTYHDDELINISNIYDPENNYDDDVDIKQIYYIIHEFLIDEIENKYDYNEFFHDDLIYNKYELIDLFIVNIENIVDNIINQIDDELNKSYNKIHHVEIKSIY